MNKAAVNWGELAGKLQSRVGKGLDRFGSLVSGRRLEKYDKGLGMTRNNLTANAVHPMDAFGNPDIERTIRESANLRSARSVEANKVLGTRLGLIGAGTAGAYGLGKQSSVSPAILEAIERAKMEAKAMSKFVGKRVHQAPVDTSMPWDRALDTSTLADYADHQYHGAKMAVYAEGFKQACAKRGVNPVKLAQVPPMSGKPDPAFLKQLAQTPGNTNVASPKQQAEIAMDKVKAPAAPMAE